MSDARSPYEVLGVDEDAAPEAITAAYRRLAQEWHPDKNPERVEEATRRFAEINNSYAVLSDESRRARLDDLGSTADDDFDPTVAKAIEMLVTTWMNTVANNVETVGSVDMKRQCLAYLARKDEEIGANVREEERQIRLRKKLLTRWRRRDGKPNFFANALRRDLRARAERLRKINAEWKLVDVARELLSEFEYVTADLFEAMKALSSRPGVLQSTDHTKEKRG